MKVLVAQSSLTLCDPMDCSLPGSSVHAISQARILEWVAISFPRESSRTQGSNLSPPHCRQTLYCLNRQESPKVLCLSFLHTEFFLLLTQIVGIPLPNTFSGFPTARSLIHKVLNLICKASMLQHSIISGLSPHHSTPVFNHHSVPQTKQSSLIPHDLETY